MVVNKDKLINQSRINDLLEKLKKKLTGFEVINLRGQLLGQLKDFTLDKNRRLYMVIPLSKEQTNSPVYLLSSKYIQKVEPSSQALLVDLSLAKFHQLPLYYPNDKVTEFSRQPQSSSLTQSSPNERQDLSSNQTSTSPSFSSENLEARDNPSLTDHEEIPDVVEEQTIRLLEEQLIVNRSKRKVGEIVIRKAIETRFVEVPIQSERLIIEKVGTDDQYPVEVEAVPVDQVSKNKATESLTQENIPSLGENLDQSSMPQSFITEDIDKQSFSDEDSSEIVEEEMIRLLEERLVINRSKWKVGEVVVRKEIENKIVQVPIRREKLIIEQVSPETKQIAEIDLGNGEVSGAELNKAQKRSIPSADTPYTVSGEFLSPKAVSHLLEAIALQGRHGCKKVRVELVLDDPELQDAYQKMFDRCSNG